MKLTLEFAELHTPLFLGGKNHGLKLMSKKVGDPLLVHDDKKDKLYVLHGGFLAIIPVSNVVSMTPKEPGDLIGELVAIEAEPVAPQVQTKPTGTHQKVQSAQVSTPTSHVFGEGPGHA